MVRGAGIGYHLRLWLAPWCTLAPCWAAAHFLDHPMLSGQQKTLISLISAVVARIVPEASPQILLERPKVASHGDIATNVAMQLAKPARRNPRELAQEIVHALMAEDKTADIIASAEVAGPGFINLRLTPSAHQHVLRVIQDEGEQYGILPSN